MIVLVLHCTHKERRNYAASADSTTLAAICAVLDGAERVMETDLSVGLRDGDMSELGTFETCLPMLRTSVHRGRPEVAVVRSNRRD